MAAEQVELVQPEAAGVEEVVADKGYHSDETLVKLHGVGVQSQHGRGDDGSGGAGDDEQSMIYDRLEGPAQSAEHRS